MRVAVLNHTPVRPTASRGAVDVGSESFLRLIDSNAGLHSAHRADDTGVSD